jgi:hypothetical protein
MTVRTPALSLQWSPSDVADIMSATRINITLYDAKKKAAGGGAPAA